MIQVSTQAEMLWCSYAWRSSNYELFRRYPATTCVSRTVRAPHRQMYESRPHCINIGNIVTTTIHKKRFMMIHSLFGIRSSLSFCSNPHGCNRDSEWFTQHLKMNRYVSSFSDSISQHISSLLFSVYNYITYFKLPPCCNSSILVLSGLSSFVRSYFKLNTTQVRL